ncbi:MAG: hypothetical protein LBE08_12865 [Bifidobacteriaceae bacterium]|nr:hypothetical protein [Bifidobacteriaceae bacterium]
MSLAELIVVIAISSIILSMIGTVTVSLLRNDGKNLIRESRTAELRQVSAYLTEALTFASSPQSGDPDNPTQYAAITTAKPSELTFYSALPTDTAKGKGALTEITIKLGSDCWTGAADPGVLHQCVREPYKFAGGKSDFCAYAAIGPSCPASLFTDSVVARGVKDSMADPIFAYYFKADSSEVRYEVTGDDLGKIEAIEFRVTVVGENDDQPIEATIYKYFSINEWSRV